MSLFGEERPKKKDAKQFHHVLGTGSRTADYDENQDFYKTPRWAVEALLFREKFGKYLIDPCCGDGVIAKECIREGYQVEAIDLVDRGYGHTGIDYLTFVDKSQFDGVIMNPPFKLLSEFLLQALRHTKEKKGKVALISRLAVLESKERKDIFQEFPPETVYVFSNRVNFIGPDGREIPSSMAVCWMIWNWATMKQAEPKLRWI